MSTLKQKLKKVPSPIREMIMDNIKNCSFSGNALEDDEDIVCAFTWHSAKHISDSDFWLGVDNELMLMP